METTRLADEIRPKNIDEMVGQAHLFGERGVIRRLLSAGRISNMIFYGPPGTGKTTAAEIIARESGMAFYRLNATTASLSDVKEVLGSTSTLFASGGVLLYLDEIQYFNKKQQQALLEYIEDGRVTLIASTTDNPHFAIYNAILSRSALFEFFPVAPSDCVGALRRGLAYLEKREGKQKICSDDTLLHIASVAKGDVRRALGLLENAYFGAEDEIDDEVLLSFCTGVQNFDEDTHFDLLSCLQKSIRGSDPDAAVFYLARLLSAGELLSACRRLQVIASEDIGLAYPLAAVVTKACCDSARELGMPEAEIPLANAAILLATSPKSNSANEAIKAADKDIADGLGRLVPEILQSPLFKGYKYPHAYPGHWVDQRYLPEDLRDRVYYHPGENKLEQASAEYFRKIKGEKNQ